MCWNRCNACEVERSRLQWCREAAVSILSDVRCCVFRLQVPDDLFVDGKGRLFKDLSSRRRAFASAGVLVLRTPSANSSRTAVDQDGFKHGRCAAAAVSSEECTTRGS